MIPLPQNRWQAPNFVDVIDTNRSPVFVRITTIDDETHLEVIAFKYDGTMRRNSAFDTILTQYQDW